MKAALRSLLLADSEVSALVGQSINWDENPQGGALPYIVLHKVSGEEWRHMNGPNGVFQSRVQIDAYAETPKGADDISQAVNALLNCYRSGGFRFIEQLNDSARKEGGSNEAERPFRASMDFMITWRPEL